MLLLLCLHAALGLAMHKLPALATIHSVSTILAALAISLYAKRPALLLMCACYVAGSEVLWRMSKAFVFHETAKYVIALICVIALFRLKKARISGGLLFYFILLLPSVIITYYSFSFDGFRKSVLFNLSSPIALTATIAFCSNIEVKLLDLWKSVLAFATPLAGVAAITLVSTYWRDSIRFTTDANFETSGGFGPNQVASSLALAVLLLVMAVLLSHFRAKVRIGLLLLACIFLVQSVMTFSRGGTTATVITLLISAPFFSLTPRQKRIAAGALLILLVTLPAAFFTLNRFTGGKLQKRFSQTQMSGRESLMQADLQLWADNPVFGVGVGISKFSHFGYTASHTEFTRAVAESGTLGALAYAILGAVCLRRAFTIIRERWNPLRPALLSLMVWPWLYMVVNAGRTAAPALALGMAFITVSLQSAPNQPLRPLGRNC